MVLYRRPVPKERRQSCLSQLQCTMSFVTDVGEFWRTVLFGKTKVVVSGEFDESEFSAKEAIDSAIENEVHDNLESPIWGCDFSVQEM